MKKRESVIHSVCLTLCNSIEYSQPGSSVHGIRQTRILEWVAISFSGGLPKSGVDPGSPALQADSLQSEPLGTLWLSHRCQSSRCLLVTQALVIFLAASSCETVSLSALLGVQTMSLQGQVHSRVCGLCISRSAQIFA